jgi:hypothetical protein
MDLIHQTMKFSDPKLVEQRTQTIKAAQQNVAAAKPRVTYFQIRNVSFARLAAEH